MLSSKSESFRRMALRFLLSEVSPPSSSGEGASQIDNTAESGVETQAEEKQKVFKEHPLALQDGTK